MIKHMLDQLGFDMLQHVIADHEIRRCRQRLFARNGRIVFVDRVAQVFLERSFPTAVVEDRAAVVLMDEGTGLCCPFPRLRTEILGLVHALVLFNVRIGDQDLVVPNNPALLGSHETWFPGPWLARDAVDGSPTPGL